MLTIRHDWYQTEEKVVVIALLKKPEERNCRVDIEEDRVILAADDCGLELDLCEPVNAQKSFYKISTVKIEITLFKMYGRHWADLSKQKAQSKPNLVSIYRHDWDTLAKQIEQDKTDGDEAVNEVFQKLYQSATPEARRAMNKSFSESNGTVLSTNWDEVAAKKVDTSPPEGTEFKKWE